MSSKTKFYINKTLLQIAEKKNIEIKILIKNTTQFISILTITINEHIEKVLDTIINEYKKETREQLSDEYKKIWVQIAPNQKKIYQNIKELNKKEVINEVISIAINNYYFNLSEIKYIKEDCIVNHYTLDFFTKKEFKESNISGVETILKKSKSIIDKKSIIPSFYSDLIKKIFEYYEIDKTKLSLLNNYSLSIFLLQEFEKIYFVMNIHYNMSLKNKNKYLRSIKPKYEKILMKKHNNNLALFINNEINFAKNMSINEEAMSFLDFYYEIMGCDEIFDN